MALRHRDIVADRENLNCNPKPQLAKQLSLASRPALDDLGNKLHAAQDLPKKHESTKDIKQKQLIKGNLTKKKEIINTTTQSFSSRQLEQVVDPDVKDTNDPQLVVEYLGDIYKYLRELEVKYPIREKFLEGHKSTPKMRAILVNWLVQVHGNFKLCLETLHLCVGIIDRYLQDNRDVGRDTLQLVGTSALFAACKYEEMYLPTLNDFVYICDDTFSHRQIKRMEMDILRKLDFSLGRPSSIHFLRRWSKIAQVKFEHHTLSKYILELALLDHNMSHIRPSMQAAAACCLSLSIINEVTCPSSVWTATLAHYTTYPYSKLKPLVIKFAHMILMSSEGKNQAIQSRYAASEHGKISRDARLKGPLVRKLAQFYKP